jgi:molecular chaperone GrpE
MTDTTDPNAPQATPEPAPEAKEMTAEERLVMLAQEMEALRDKWLRSEAEMQNLRTRTQREVADARAYATQKFASDVVEAAENLRRGIEALPPVAEDEPDLLTKLRSGFEGVERSFLGILERNGVQRQDPKGQPFDPEKAPGHGRTARAGRCGTWHGHPWLDFRLDIEWPPAEARHGGGGEG